MTPPNRPESAQPPAPDFAAATAALDNILAKQPADYAGAGFWARAFDNSITTVLSVLSQAESRLSLLEAQNAELRASQGMAGKALTEACDVRDDLLAALKVFGIEPPENDGEEWSRCTEDGPEPAGETAVAAAEAEARNTTRFYDQATAALEAAKADTLLAASLLCEMGYATDPRISVESTSLLDPAMRHLPTQRLNVRAMALTLEEARSVVAAYWASRSGQGETA